MVDYCLLLLLRFVRADGPVSIKKAFLFPCSGKYLMRRQRAITVYYYGSSDCLPRCTSYVSPHFLRSRPAGCGDVSSGFRFPSAAEKKSEKALLLLLPLLPLSFFPLLSTTRQNLACVNKHFRGARRRRTEKKEGKYKS